MQCPQREPDFAIAKVIVVPRCQRFCINVMGARLRPATLQTAFTRPARIARYQQGSVAPLTHKTTRQAKRYCTCKQGLAESYA
jgi:hypothetical protein